jgi:transcriptional regulator with XRE-family HTH domain
VQTRLREMRKRKGWTLEDVAAACEPPTTAQTIGRLETGMRNVSVGWLNRIAKALGVDPSDLVTRPDRPELPVLALVRGTQVEAYSAVTPPVVAPNPLPGTLALRFETALGDYRGGDELVLERLEGPHIARALNRDVLAETSGGRLVFARLTPSAKPDRVSLAPLVPGEPLIADVRLPWVGLPTLLIRRFN